MSWTAFIGAGVSVWAKKVLISLGIGVVSYAGLTVLKSQLEAYIFSAIAGIPADAYSIFAMAGMIDAINIWLAAFTVIVTMMAGKKLGML